MSIRRFFHDVKNYVELNKFQCVWRKKNQHNNTLPLMIFPIDCVTVGKDTYGRLNVHCFSNVSEKLIIGNYCSIASGVNFVLGGEHDYKKLFNYPFEAIYSDFATHEAVCKGPIVVKDDAWIGINSTIMSGVTIGQGAVIGAGSLVTHDVPPYGIYYNGKIQKYRFSSEIIEELNKIDFSLISRENYESLREIIYSSVNINNICELKKRLADASVQK